MSIELQAIIFAAISTLVYSVILCAIVWWISRCASKQAASPMDEGMNELRVIDVTTDGLIFERDGLAVHKSFPHEQYDGVSKEDGRRYAMALVRAAREADRDLAVAKHGYPYRQHCQYQMDWWEGMPASEGRKLAHQIIAILEDKAALPDDE